MAGYLKKIAVIKQIKGGFSADGGVISGLIKVETYAGYLKAEVSLINFAPLSEGRYVFGLTDGTGFVMFEDVMFECESKLDLQNGFAFVICFCKSDASPIASAYCGQGAGYLTLLSQEMQRREQVKPKKGSGAAYDDEAISEVNYYEDKVDKGGNPLFEDKKEEELQHAGGENEKDLRPVKIQAEGQDGVSGQSARSGEDSVSGEKNDEEPLSGGESAASGKNDEEPLSGGLAGGDFYSRMKGDIEKIFSTHPKAAELEEVLKGGRFVKVEYGEGQHYAFGVLYVGGNAVYICYGVPSSNPVEPPKSLKGFSSYIPCKNGGYWMTYQDAKTGVSVDIEVT
ncbi:MAG: hypothetical protein ACI4QI_02510 [Candidatus Coproplasma sp.]